ncbi:MAG: flagellar hook-basal body complex protein FliE [Anaerohalosphaera sp.]|nr:flagellar hook-basal body complex protein FliE [Anaerohalosphaera sp.]
MVNFNANVANINSIAQGQLNSNKVGSGQKSEAQNSKFSDAMKVAEKYLDSVNEQQSTADTAIKDLLTGKNNDITAVVAEATKADMSFKLLVGVRNKMIEAYKQTMNMPL